MSEGEGADRQRGTVKGRAGARERVGGWGGNQAGGGKKRSGRIEKGGL